MSGTQVSTAIAEDRRGADREREREILYIGELEIRLDEGLVLAAGRPLTFSVREFRMLAALVARAGGIVSREDLYEAVWRRQLRAGDRSVDVYVSKVRGKLGQVLPDHRFIHTHPGFGYRFEAPLSRNLDNSAAGGGKTRPGARH
jgi:DNA-binding response OmpR family regulator